MKVWLLLGMALVATQLTACGGGGAASSQNSGTSGLSAESTTANVAVASQTSFRSTLQPPAEFIDARAKWQAAEVHSYSFWYKEGGGYKFAVYPFVQVVVIANKVTSVDGAPAAADDEAAQRLTIDRLLADLHKQYTQTHANPEVVNIVGASFDEILGFPTSIHTGWGDCCDQDHELAIKDLHITAE